MPRPVLPRLLSLVGALVLALGLLLGAQVAHPRPAAAAGEPSPAPTVTATASPSAAEPSATKPSATEPSATATPSPTATPKAAPSSTASTTATPAAADQAAAAAALPVLSVQVAGAPATIARTGQVVTYTVTVKNTGNGALRDLAVSAVAPDLPTLVCSPVALGATLYTSTTTTCTARRTSTATDLLTTGQDVSATAAGFATAGTAVTGTASVRTTVSTLAPRTTNDSVTVLANTAPVVLAGSTNDSPGETGGPAVDGTRTEILPASGTGPATRARTTPHGTFLVLVDGSIRYAVKPDPDGYPAGWTDAVSYRTYDVAGKSAVGTATVVVRRPPVAADDSLVIAAGQTTTLDPLANDKAGQLLDGTDATLVPSTLRFTARQFGPGTVNAAGDTKTLPNTGVFTVSGGKVTFVSDARSIEPAGVTYSVADTSGVVATGDITVGTTGAGEGGGADPVVTHDVASTTFATPVTLPGVLNDTPAAPGHTVSFGGFVGFDHVTNFGNTLSTPQGAWSLAPSGAVLFSPAWGYSGTTIRYYLTKDSGGGETVSALTVHVQPGPVARPDTLATRAGTDGTTNPAANDVPGLRADGTPGTFDPRWAIFPTTGQPSGAVVTGNGKTLTLPGRGVLWFSNGTVTFRPQAGFRGFAGTVAYQVEDTSRPGAQRGIAVVGRLAVLATSDALTATDDAATTVLNKAVTLPAAGNDDPGSTTTALRPTFPAAGQPTGSTRSSNGLTLTVPGQGVWAASASVATVTFTPATKYAGTTTPVTYQIAGAGGATATAHLQVTVAAGPAAKPDLLTLAGSPDAAVEPLLNDVPGRSADGQLGTFEPASIQFPADGQPAGAVTGGRTLSVPAQGSRPAFTVSSGSEYGLVLVTVQGSFDGTLPPVAYSVLSDVVDSTGTVSKLYTRSTFQVKTTGGGDIVTTDDHVTVRAGQTASLPGASNDSPAPGFPLDFDEMGFPSDQLADLPPGSEIRDDPHGHDHEYSLVVPGEGTWKIEGGGFMAFFPEAGFVGDASPVKYFIFDFAGIHSGTGTETVTVLPPAVPKDDTGFTPQGVPVVVHTLANDTPERDALGRPLDVAGTVTFDPARRPNGSTLTAGSGNTQLVVPGQGTYTIDQLTGDVRYVPDPTFRGSATAFYLLVPGGSSRFQVILADVDPALNADSSTTTPGTPKRVRVLQNDQPGDPARPLVPGSVRLVASPLQTPPTTVTADGQISINPGRGLFAVAGDGNVTFYPLAGVTGNASVPYSVLDANGTKAIASLAIRVA